MKLQALMKFIAENLKIQGQQVLKYEEASRRGKERG